MSLGLSGWGWKRVAAVVAVALALLPAALQAGARLVLSWKNPAYTGAAPKNVLVIGMSNDPRIRLDFEDDLAAALTKDGVKVTPGNHILLRPDSPEMDENYLKGQIRDHQIDGVIVSRMVSVNTKETYTPGTRYAVPYGYYNNLYGYYGTVYRQVYTPGYLQKDMTVRVETNFYSAGAAAGDAGDGELIWTGTSDSFNPGSATKVIDEVVKVVAKELKKKNIL